MHLQQKNSSQQLCLLLTRVHSEVDCEAQCPRDCTFKLAKQSLTLPSV